MSRRSALAQSIGKLGELAKIFDQCLGALGSWIGRELPSENLPEPIPSRCGFPPPPSPQTDFGGSRPPISFS